VYELGPGLEQRLGELQSQIDQLTVSLERWRHKEEQLQPTEERLLQLTERCAEVLDRWTTAGARHAEALDQIETRLSGLKALEGRVQEDASARVHDLEQAIEHEWMALRQIHEEPVRHLREQAISLAEVSVAAASTAQRGFERTEARLAALETGIHRQLADLSFDLRAAVAELRSSSDRSPAALADTASAWPLEGVMRLHNQLRRTSQGTEAGPAVPGEPPVAATVPSLPPAVVADSNAFQERLSSLEQALSDGKSEIAAVTEQGQRVQRRGWTAAVLAIVVAIGSVGAIWWVENQAETRVARAEEATKRARQEASEQVASVSRDASKQLDAARGTAIAAQMVSDVVAAPDVIRFNLMSDNAASRNYAHVLWSRTRGVVFSGARLPAPPAGSVYQVWLTTSDSPVSAGSFLPDQSGRATFATDDPPRIPRPVTNAFVTVEPEGGSSKPSETVLLRPIPRPAAPASP